MIKDILNFFPEGYTANAQQVAILQQIERAFNAGKKFIIVNAPTGSGKSFISKTLANLAKAPTDRYLELVNSYKAFARDYKGHYLHEDECQSLPPHGAFVLTITKNLQDQYLQQFSDAIVIKGKTNYQCDIDDQFSVDVAPCVFQTGLKEKCWREQRCPYYETRNSGLRERFGVLNYKMFLSIPDHVKTRNYIICDEASELEEEMVKQYSVDINYKMLKFAGIAHEPLRDEEHSHVRIWLTDLKQKVVESRSELVTLMGKKSRIFTQTERNKLNYLVNLQTALETVDEYWNYCEYVVDRTAEFVNLTPLKVDVAMTSIYNFAEKIVLMSATIIDHKHFAKRLGITDYEYIEVGSVFDPTKSPIKVSSRYSLNHANLVQHLPQICRDVETLCQQHSTEKGIIHTQSQSICDSISRGVKDKSRLLFRADADRNEDILELHFNSKDPTVLVSPSLKFGVDLRDDLARFQIIVKMPYLPLQSKRIKKLFDMDREWYENKMLGALVQMCGRSTRTPTDHSITYILDGNVVGILKRCKHKLPKHFLDRFA